MTQRQRVKEREWPYDRVYRRYIRAFNRGYRRHRLTQLRNAAVALAFMCLSAYAGTVAEKLDDGIPASSSAITPTKGSLWIADGTCFFPFVIGANGTVLKADSAQTYGVSWGTVSGSGTVTSVAQSFTGGLISVGGSPITGSGTLALTVAGTSGGVVYFPSSSTWASSGALTANALVIGGGAGTAPSTTTTGTGVLTALGVNTGSAGAFVLFNGAGGTPSSLTLTNATGLTSAGIVDGTIVNADVSATAAIAGTKIAPDFGSQTIKTSPADLSVGFYMYRPSSTNTALSMYTNSNTPVLAFSGSTSGTAELQPPAIVAGGGTASITLPNASSTLPIYGQQITYSGPTAARTITVPDGNFTTARTDAANTFTGASSTTSWAETTPAITNGLTASGSGANDFSGSSGLFKTSSGTNTLNGTTNVTAATPSVTLTSGNTNTGYFEVDGKTSGSLRIKCADATAQQVIVTTAAQTTGGTTLTIPDCANTNYTFSFITKAETLTNKSVDLASNTLTFTSAQLATACSNETGSGALVFGTSPDFTTGITIASVAVPTISSTNTFTNKRVTKRVTSISSSATPTVNTDNCELVDITALAAAITSVTTNLSGTPNVGDSLIFHILDNGTARAITWGTSFESGPATLPTTTTVSKKLFVGFFWNSASSKWCCVATGSQQ